MLLHRRALLITKTTDFRSTKPVLQLSFPQ